MTAIHQLCARLQKWFKALEKKFGISLADELHLVITFFMAWVIRGCVLKSAWAWIPLLAIFILKEVYDMYKPDKTGFSLKDLMLDLMGGAVGYCLAALCTAIIR